MTHTATRGFKVNELMAFIVLSLPLLAILLIVIVAALAARAVALRTEGPEKNKSIAAAIAMVILIPTWDKIAGGPFVFPLSLRERRWRQGVQTGQAAAGVLECGWKPDFP
jgi:hypothetical protein